MKSHTIRGLENALKETLTMFAESRQVATPNVAEWDILEKHFHDGILHYLKHIEVIWAGFSQPRQDIESQMEKSWYLAMRQLKAGTQISDCFRLFWKNVFPSLSPDLFTLPPRA